MRQAATNKSGPISPCSNWLMKIPSGRRASSRCRLALRMDSGSRRRSSPSIASTSKAQSCTFLVVLAGMQRVEVGDALHAQHHRLAVDDEPRLPVLQRGLDDPRIAAGPVIAAARDQPHAVAAGSCRLLQALPPVTIFREPNKKGPRACQHQGRGYAPILRERDAARQRLAERDVPIPNRLAVLTQTPAGALERRRGPDNGQLTGGA
jgi:hypothetical protein